MATYKVIQDIEAEDKLVGPLSFRQFIYALIAAFCFYISFVCLTKHVTFLLVIFLPPGLVAAFFAVPFGKDQPTEVWAVAKLRFFFKPRRRVWDQSGVKELVTITVPKKIEKMRTNGLSQMEVNSRLSALANTIDSRGWAVKNVNLNMVTQPVATGLVNQDSDRLLDASHLPQEVATTDIQAADDILDEQNNPIAHQFDAMINASSQAHHDQLMNMMSAPTTAAPGASGQGQAAGGSSDWFLNQPVNQGKAMASLGITQAQPGVVQAAEPTADEEAFALKLKSQHTRPSAAYGNLKTIQPLGTPAAPQATASQTSQPQTAAKTVVPPVTAAPSPAILNLANNNDLNVATLARQARKNPDLPDEGEVVIALH